MMSCSSGDLLLVLEELVIVSFTSSLCLKDACVESGMFDDTCSLSESESESESVSLLFEYSLLIGCSSLIYLSIIKGDGERGHGSLPCSLPVRLAICSFPLSMLLVLSVLLVSLLSFEFGTDEVATL